MALNDAGPQPVRMIRAGHLIDGVGEGLLCKAREVEVIVVDGRPAIECWEPPGNNGIHSGVGELSLPDRPPESIFRTVRPIDSHDDIAPPVGAGSCHFSHAQARIPVRRSATRGARGASA